MPTCAELGGGPLQPAAAAHVLHDHNRITDIYAGCQRAAFRPYEKAKGAG